MLASRPLAAVGGQSLRQPLVQHPDIAFTQGVDEGRGIRTAVKHLAAFGIQGVYLDIEGVLEYPDDIHNGQFLSLRTVTDPAAINAATSSIRSLSVPFQRNADLRLQPCGRISIPIPASSV